MGKCATGFPPLNAVCLWYRVLNGIPVRVVASVKRWRPSGELRVYTFEIDGAEAQGVVDCDPETGQLTIVPVDSEADRALPLTFLETPNGR
jgi:hypothetical protein